MNYPKHLVLSSEASSELFPLNSAANFTSHLEHATPHHHDDNTMVALSSLTFDHAFSEDYFPSELGAVENHILLYTKYDFERLTLGAPRVEPLYTFTVRGRLTSPQELVTNLTGQFTPSTRRVFQLTLTGRRIVIRFKPKNHTLLILKSLAEHINFHPVATDTSIIHHQTYLVYDRKRFRHLRSSPFKNGSFTGSRDENLRPKFVAVHLEEINSQQQARTLSLIPYSDSTRLEASTVFHHEPKHLEFFKFHHRSYNQFNIELRDEKNRPLRLISAQPTIVGITIQKMLSSSFVLRLSSETTLTHLNNQPADFSSVQNPVVNFDGHRWAAALTAIHVPNTFDWYHYFSDELFWMVLRVGDNIDDSEVESEEVDEDMEAERHFVQLFFDIDTFKEAEEEVLSTESIIDRIKSKLAAPFENDEGGVYVFQHNAVAAEDQSYLCLMVDRPTRITLSRNMASFLGYKPLEPNSNEVTFLVRNEIFFPSSPSMFNVLPHSFLLQSDLVHFSTCFSKQLPALKLFTVSKKDVRGSQQEGANNYITYEPQHLEFVSLRAAQLSRMHFRLSDYDNEDVHFANNDLPTRLSITFQKQQN